MTIPTTTFLTDLITGMAEMLAAADLDLTWDTSGAYEDDDTAIIDSAVPISPARLVTLTVYPLTDDPEYADSDVGLQVRSRWDSQDPRDVRALDTSIFNELAGRAPFDTSTGIRVRALRRTSAVSLGRDENQRWMFVSNYLLGLHQPGTYRL